MPQRGGNLPPTLSISLWLVLRLIVSQKSGKDAAEWLPDLNRCWFARRVIEVRYQYDLTIDERERDVLEKYLVRLHIHGIDCPENSPGFDSDFRSYPQT